MDDLPLLQQFQKYAPALRVLLEEPGFDLATTLIAAVPNNEVDRVVRPLLPIFCAANKDMDFMTVVLKEQVAATSQESTLFRNLVPCTMCMSTYAKLTGMEYLRTLLGPLVEKISNAPSFETDPCKAGHDEDMEANMEILKQHCSEVLDVVCESVVSDMAVPEPLWRLCELIRSTVEDCFLCVLIVFKRMVVGLFLLTYFIVRKFPNSANSAIGGLFFLRFMMPAIVSPDGHGIVKSVSSTGRRNLVLVTKIIQTLSNGVRFKDKEAFMKSANPFLDEKQPVIDKILTVLGNGVPVHLPSSGKNQLQPTEEDICRVFDFLIRYLDKVVIMLEQEKSAILDELFEVLPELGAIQPPAGVDPTADRKSSPGLEPELPKEKSKLDPHTLTISHICESPQIRHAFSKFSADHKIEGDFWNLCYAIEYAQLGDRLSRCRYFAEIACEDEKRAVNFIESLEEKTVNRCMLGDYGILDAYQRELMLKLRGKIESFCQSSHGKNVWKNKHNATAMNKDNFSTYMNNAAFRQVYADFLREEVGRARLVGFVAASDEYRQCIVKDERAMVASIIIREYIAKGAVHHISFDRHVVANVLLNLQAYEPLLFDQMRSKATSACRVYVDKFRESEWLAKFLVARKDALVVHTSRRRLTHSGRLVDGVMVGGRAAAGQSMTVRAVKGVYNKVRDLGDKPEGKSDQEDARLPDEPATEPRVLIRDEDWEVLTDGAESKTFEQDQIIVQRGAPTQFMLIRSGQARVEMLSRHGKLRTRMGVVEEGDIIGEVSFLKQRKSKKATADVIAHSEEVTVFIIPFKTLQKNLASNDNLATRFYLALCQRVAARLLANKPPSTDSSKKDINASSKSSASLLDRVGSRPETLKAASTDAGEDPDWVEAGKIVRKLGLEGSAMLGAFQCTLVSNHLRSMQPRGHFIVLQHLLIFYSKLFNRKVQIVCPPYEIQGMELKGSKVTLSQRRADSGLSTHPLRFKDSDSAVQAHELILKTKLHQTGDLEAPNSIAPLSPRSSEAQKRSQSALMADPKWEKMLSAAKLVTFAKGEKVLTHGNYANALIQIVTGRCRVEIPTHVNGTNEPLHISTLSPPCIVGEIGFVLQTPASADVIAQDEKVIAVAFDSAELNQFLSSNPDLGPSFYLYLGKTLAKRLMKLQTKQARGHKKSKSLDLKSLELEPRISKSNSARTPGAALQWP